MCASFCASLYTLQCHLYTEHGVVELKNMDCYDFTACEIIIKLTAHCHFNRCSEIISKCGRKLASG